MGTLVIIEQRCSRIIDTATDEECRFVGDVETYVYNEVDEDHADMAWTCPSCDYEHVEGL